jgi:hypothetical protein
MEYASFRRDFLASEAVLRTTAVYIRRGTMSRQVDTTIMAVAKSKKPQHELLE